MAALLDICRSISSVRKTISAKRPRTCSMDRRWLWSDRKVLQQRMCASRRVPQLHQHHDHAEVRWRTGRPVFGFDSLPISELQSLRGADCSKNGNAQSSQITESIVVIIRITCRIIIISLRNNQHHTLSCPSHQNTIRIFQIGLSFFLSNFLPT